MLPINDLQRHHAALNQPIREAVDRVLARGHYILGPENAALEAAFSAYLGTPESVTVGNGTDALELALRALGIGPGDEVITVANAGGYASTAIHAVGANARYVDIEPHRLLMETSAVLAAITPATRAVIATHLYGRMVDLRVLAPTLEQAGVALVEDCAQAHGACLDGRRAGAWGALSTFSFYPTKNLGAMGDGGLVSGTDHAALARVRQLRQYGWQKKYHVGLKGGRNSRMDELQAAVVLAKLPHLDTLNARRRTISARYSEGLARLTASGWYLPAPPDDADVAHLYVVQVPDRESLRAFLGERGIATDIHYPVPDHRQAAWQQAVQLPNTDAAAARLLTLPCFPEMTDDEVCHVIETCLAYQEREQ